LGEYLSHCINLKINGTDKEADAPIFWADGKQFKIGATVGGNSFIDEE
jgi:hypothetical protein